MEISIQQIIQERIENLGKQKYLNERQSLLKEIHEVLILENKLENYYRYRHWKKNNQGNPEDFKKAKLPITHKYIKPITPSFLGVKLSHIPTKDLYYLISRKNDYKHREKYRRSAFTKWLFFSIKAN